MLNKSLKKDGKSLFLRALVYTACCGIKYDGFNTVCMVFKSIFLSIHTGCEHTNPLDVVFSVSAHTNRYESEMTFKLISQVMSKATIGQGNIQFGLARRDCGNAWQQVALNQYDTMDAYSREFAVCMLCSIASFI